MQMSHDEAVERLHDEDMMFPDLSAVTFKSSSRGDDAWLTVQTCPVSWRSSR